MARVPRSRNRGAANARVTATGPTRVSGGAAARETENARATQNARAAETAGAVEPFRDAALYDWEYRRRRNDVAFYRMLAAERGGPILDLGCGTGRLLIPLGADGFKVVGVDLSPSMLERTQQRRRRAEGASRAGKIQARADRNVERTAASLVVKGDLRALPLRGTFPLVVMAFHTIQHLVEDDDLERTLRSIRGLLGTDGWFAFDVFAPSAAWLARPANRRFDPIVFHHPKTGRRLQYSVSHRLDRERRALHMRFHYRPVSATNVVSPRGTTVRLCHRQLTPDEVTELLRRAGLRIIARWGGFHGEPLHDGADSEQHVYLARPAR